MYIDINPTEHLGVRGDQLGGIEIVGHAEVAAECAIVWTAQHHANARGLRSIRGRCFDELHSERDAMASQHVSKRVIADASVENYVAH